VQLEEVQETQENVSVPIDEVQHDESAMATG